MIFKTFNNDIDKISAKWGIFGKSFNDIGTAISGKISDINKNFQATDDLIGSIKNSGDGIWSRLYPTKEQIASLQINVPELIDTKKANEYLNIMNQIDAGIHPVLSSYQEWHDELADGEKWIAKYAQSTKGQIRSLESVNEANQSARASALAHNEALKQQTLGAKAATVAMKALSVVGNMLAMYAITKLITAYSDYKEKLHDIAEEMSAQAKKSSDYVDNLLDLKTQLEEGAKSSDELISAFKDQLEAMGYTETEIDNLINKYNGLSGAIDEATRKALENAKTDAYADVASASKALEIDSDGGLFTDILIGDYKTGLEQLDSEIEKILSDVATKTAQQGKAWISKDNSAEGLYEYYNALKDVSRLIQETASETNNNELLDLGNAFDPTVYGEVTEAINKLKDSAELYGEAISRLHNADAQLELSDYLKTNDINSKETFDNYINGIKNSTEYSESYKQVLIDVANKAFPQFSQQAKNAAETLDNFGNKTDISLSISDTVNQLNTKLKPAMDSLKSAYQSIFTEDGFTLDSVSSSMLSSIQDSILALNNLEGADIDIPIEDFEKFADVLTNVNTTEEQADDAFDNLATSIINGIGVTGQLSDETAGLVIQLLEEMGIVNANEVVTNALALQKERLAQASKISSETTYEHAVELVNEAGASEIAGMALAQLALEKIHVNGQTISTSADIENIIALANAAGASAEALATLTQAKAILAGGDAYGRTQQDWAADILSQINNGTYKYGFNLDADDFKVDFKGVGKDSASKAGKDAGEAYVDGLESVISAIGTIVGDRIDDLNDQMDDALEVFDLQIEGLEAQIDAIDDEIDHKNDLIDSIQDEIDAIQEANEERQRAIDLQKAEYNLERMLNQRTKLIYTEDANGKGQFRYKTDTSELRDARDQVDDAKTAIQIAEKEKAIKAIEREIELLEDSKDAINAQIEAIERQKEATQKYFEQMIEALENYQDKFDRLTQLKSMAEAEATLQKFGYSVEDILNMSDEAFQAFAKDYVNAIAGANSENDLFLQSLEKLSGIELTGVSDGLNNVAKSATEASNAISGGGGGGSTTAPQSEGGNKGGGTSSGGGLAKGLEDVGVASDEHIEQNVIPDFESSKKAVDDVSASIGTGGENLTDKGFPSSKEGSQDGGEAGTLTGNIVGLGKTTDEVISGEEGVTNKFTELNTPLGEANTHMSEMKTTLEELASQEWVVKVKVETIGGALPTGFGNVNGNLFNDKEFTIPYGNAYVNGGVSGATVDYNALVGELGAEMLVRDNRWRLVGLNGTEFVDVRKGDILFNHKQTEQLLKHGSITGRGKAYANGTVGTLPHLIPLQEGDKMFDLIKKLSENNDLIQNGIIPPVNSIQKNAEIMARNINHVNNRNTTTQDINININGGINLQGVQDPDALAKAINQRLPNSLKQELFKRK